MRTSVVMGALWSVASGFLQGSQQQAAIYEAVVRITHQERQTPVATAVRCCLCPGRFYQPYNELQLPKEDLASTGRCCSLCDAWRWVFAPFMIGFIPLSISWCAPRMVSAPVVGYSAVAGASLCVLCACCVCCGPHASLSKYEVVRDIADEYAEEKGLPPVGSAPAVLHMRAVTEDQKLLPHR